MLNVLDKGFVSWVAKNKMTFLMLILITGNVYQYVEKINSDNKFIDEQRRLNQVIQDMEQKSVEYERGRSEKLEYLLNNLSKMEQLKEK
jgi:hypothetical protein